MSPRLRRRLDGEFKGYFSVDKSINSRGFVQKTIEYG